MLATFLKTLVGSIFKSLSFCVDLYISKEGSPFKAEMENLMHVLLSACCLHENMLRSYVGGTFVPVLVI